MTSELFMVLNSISQMRGGNWVKPQIIARIEIIHNDSEALSTDISLKW